MGGPATHTHTHTRSRSTRRQRPGEGGQARARRWRSAPLSCSASFPCTCTSARPRLRGAFQTQRRAAFPGATGACGDGPRQAVPESHRGENEGATTHHGRASLVSLLAPLSSLQPCAPGLPLSVLSAPRLALPLHVHGERRSGGASLFSPRKKRRAQEAVRGRAGFWRLRSLSCPPFPRRQWRSASQRIASHRPPYLRLPWLVVQEAAAESKKRRERGVQSSAANWRRAI